jgi:hypothetical protein
LKDEAKTVYLINQFVPRSKQFYLGYKNQSIFVVWGRSHCLFSGKNKTHKYNMGGAYIFWMLNLFGASRNQKALTG